MTAPMNSQRDGSDDEELGRFLAAGDDHLLELIWVRDGQSRTLTSLLAVTDNGRGSARQQVLLRIRVRALAVRVRDFLPKVIRLDTNLLGVMSGDCAVRASTQGREPMFGHPLLRDESESGVMEFGRAMACIRFEIDEVAAWYSSKRLRAVAASLHRNDVGYLLTLLARVRATLDEDSPRETDPRPPLEQASQRVTQLKGDLELVTEVLRQLPREPINAVGADLTGIDVPDIAVLTGLVWDHQTRWTPRLRTRVKENSTKIAAGVYRIAPGGGERYPHLQLS